MNIIFFISVWLFTFLAHDAHAEYQLLTDAMKANDFDLAQRLKTHAQTYDAKMSALTKAEAGNDVALAEQLRHL